MTITYAPGNLTTTNEEIVKFVGAVLETREENYYDDSDFYAVCWDEEKQAVVREDYNTTRFAGGGSATVDATPEVIAKAKAWTKNWFINKLNNWNVEEAKKPTAGKVVEVVKGRKIKIGTVATVKWGGEVKNKFDYNRSSSWRVSLEIEGETVWTNGANVKVVDYKKYMKSSSEIEAMAEARSTYWIAPFTRTGLVVF